MTPLRDKPVRIIDIGVFACNEAQNIAALIGDVARQSVFARANADIDVRLLILANGCTDDTVLQAKAAREHLEPSIAGRIEVLDFVRGGKSRTMHHFIQEDSRREVDLLGFMDADIHLPEPDTLARMIDQLLSRPALQTFTSRPVKDITLNSEGSGLIARVIAAGGGGLTDYRNAICGQLFMMRAPMARQIGLPDGLPVEDGFIRAMMLTDLLSAPEEFGRIDGDPEIYHIYESIRTIPELIRHQTRIVIGSAVNAVLFARIRRDAGTREEAHALLMAAGADESWLARVLKEDLPIWPHGYVPFSYLIWRLQAYRDSGKSGLKSLIMLILGLGFDLVVYLRASFHMATRQSAGHW